MKLAGSEELRRTFGNRAKETVAAFDIDTTVRKNIDLYRKLLSQSPA
jgi:hypothetical protein